MGEAIGMIETQGLISSYEAADAMVKAANVQIVKQELVDAGIVTIIVKGDVGAVQAAVSAGEAATERLGTLLGAHVIPRADDSVNKMINVQEEKIVKKVNAAAPKTPAPKTTTPKK